MAVKTETEQHQPATVNLTYLLVYTAVYTLQQSQTKNKNKFYIQLLNFLFWHKEAVDLEIFTALKSIDYNAGRGDVVYSAADYCSEHL